MLPRWIRKDAKVAGLPLHRASVLVLGFWRVERGVGPAENLLLFLVCPVYTLR